MSKKQYFRDIISKHETGNKLNKESIANQLYQTAIEKDDFEKVIEYIFDQLPINSNVISYLEQNNVWNPRSKEEIRRSELSQLILNAVYGKIDILHEKLCEIAPPPAPPVRNFTPFDDDMNVMLEAMGVFSISTPKKPTLLSPAQIRFLENFNGPNLYNNPISVVANQYQLVDLHLTDAYKNLVIENFEKLFYLINKHTILPRKFLKYVNETLSNENISNPELLKELKDKFNLFLMINNGLSDLKGNYKGEKEFIESLECSLFSFQAYKLQANINIPNPEQHNGTILHQIVWNRYESLINFALNLGANPNSRDNDGKTPLHYAVINNSYDMVKSLLDFGACVTIKDYSGKTTFDYAQSDDIKKLLEKASQSKSQVFTIN
ncbi:MAG: ankyrin repeat domain-containing protein [Sphingobacteriia bacterium]|nr:ankyrin repeat domain-containing protein [Sphingobacteriia bacterium]